MELKHCINYLLTTAQHSVFQVMNSELSVYDITPVQYGVLHCLWVLKIKSPKDIAERLKLENSTISGVLERMEKKELIVRNISPEDRRFIQVELTNKGRELEEAVLNSVEKVNIDVMSKLSPENQEQLKESLRIIAGIE